MVLNQRTSIAPRGSAMTSRVSAGGSRFSAVASAKPSMLKTVVRRVLSSGVRGACAVVVVLAVGAGTLFGENAVAVEALQLKSGGGDGKGKVSTKRGIPPTQGKKALERNEAGDNVSKDKAHLRGGASGNAGTEVEAMNHVGGFGIAMIIVGAIGALPLTLSGAWAVGGGFVLVGLVCLIWSCCCRTSATSGA